nr:MAG TPA: hypothetical protein [Caudoviricetes sp.]
MQCKGTKCFLNTYKKQKINIKGIHAVYLAVLVKSQTKF